MFVWLPARHGPPSRVVLVRTFFLKCSFLSINVVPTIQCRPTHGSVRCHVDYNRKRLIPRRCDSGTVRFVVVVALIGVSHAINLSDAVAESERWERIRHVAVEAIPRINAGGLVAKRALLECIAIV